MKRTICALRCILSDWLLEKAFMVLPKDSPKFRALGSFCVQYWKHFSEAKKATSVAKAEVLK